MNPDDVRRIVREEIAAANKEAAADAAASYVERSRNLITNGPWFKDDPETRQQLLASLEVMNHKIQSS